MKSLVSLIVLIGLVLFNCGRDINSPNNVNINLSKSSIDYKQKESKQKESSSDTFLVKRNFIISENKILFKKLMTRHVDLVIILEYSGLTKSYVFDETQIFRKQSTDSLFIFYDFSDVDPSKILCLYVHGELVE